MNYDSHETPFVSVIIPTYRRNEGLSKCLNAFLNINYQRDRFEVIVVDDGSETDVKAVVEPFQQSLNLLFLKKDHDGPAAARNHGAQHANGKYLAFIDDDCAPSRQWLCELVKRLEENPSCAVGGKTANILEDSAYSTASQLLIDYQYSYYNTNSIRSSFLTSNNLCFPAEQFLALGGFDTSFLQAGAEDREVCDRWLHHGYRLIYEPEAEVYHAHSMNFRQFLQQHFRYGMGAYHFHRLRAQRNSGTIRFEPLSFYLNSVRCPFRNPDVKRKTLFSVLLFLSQAANASGFFYRQLFRVS